MEESQVPQKHNNLTVCARDLGTYRSDNKGSLVRASVAMILSSRSRFQARK